MHKELSLGQWGARDNHKGAQGKCMGVGQHGSGLRGMVWGRERQGTILKPQDGKTFQEKHVVRGEESQQRRVGQGRRLGKEEEAKRTKD